MKKVKTPFEILDIIFDNCEVDNEVEFEKLGIDYKDPLFFKYISFLVRFCFVDATKQNDKENPRYYGYFPKAKLTKDGFEFVMRQRATNEALKLTRRSNIMTKITLIIAIVTLLVSVIIFFLSN